MAPEQIDINCFHPAGKQFTHQNLELLMEHGAAIIRLDALGYANKQAVTRCFFLEPQVWELLDGVNSELTARGVRLLPELHGHYSWQEKLSQHGLWVYDYALPMLHLNAVYYSQTRYLADWLKKCPRHQYTTLDTHDGIGVVDVEGLLPKEKMERTKEDILRFGANVKKIYNTAAYHNLDIYQVNRTYYSALGEDDNAYLLARAVQFFASGIPQIYYVGLLAGRNDLRLLEETKEGRAINRHAYSLAEVETEAGRSVVQKLFSLMRFRNTHSAFQGDCQIFTPTDHMLRIQRINGNAQAILTADFKKHSFQIEYTDEAGILNVLDMGDLK